jgi:arsenate reductase
MWLNLKTDIRGVEVMAEKAKVAFICVHNSCRSQMAEAISKIIAGDSFEAYSAGTETKPQINQDAVEVIKENLRL